MRTEEFVMRGKTPSGLTEVLNISGYKPGYAYRMVEFQIYPSTAIGQQAMELCASVTAAKTFEDPQNPDFTNEGLIATAFFTNHDATAYAGFTNSGVNDTFLITQKLIIAVLDSNVGSPMDVNWQCKFMPVKMSKTEEAVTNYKQFLISDD